MSRKYIADKMKWGKWRADTPLFYKMFVKLPSLAQSVEDNPYRVWSIVRSKKSGKFSIMEAKSFFNKTKKRYMNVYRISKLKFKTGRDASDYWEGLKL